MQSYISMLRGINVGGYNKIGMERLRESYHSLGLESVQTYLQSGNVTFQCSESEEDVLIAQIENKIKSEFGFRIIVFLRTEKEFEKLITCFPFLDKDPNKLHVTFLLREPKSLPSEEMNKYRGRGEEFLLAGREIYLYCPNGYGRTKLSNNFFERKLALEATTRNWNTVNTLFSMVSDH